MRNAPNGSWHTNQPRIKKKRRARALWSEGTSGSAGRAGEAVHRSRERSCIDHGATTSQHNDHGRFPIALHVAIFLGIWGCFNPSHHLFGGRPFLPPERCSVDKSMIDCPIRELEDMTRHHAVSQRVQGMVNAAGVHRKNICCGNGPRFSVRSQQLIRQFPWQGRTTTPAARARSWRHRSRDMAFVDVPPRSISLPALQSALNCAKYSGKCIPKQMFNNLTLARHWTCFDTLDHDVGFPRRWRCSN